MENSILENLKLVQNQANQMIATINDLEKENLELKAQIEELKNNNDNNKPQDDGTISRDVNEYITNSNYALSFDDNFSTFNYENWNKEETGEVYNNEIQYYRAKNVSIENSNLVLTAVKENYGGKQWTSGRINSSKLKQFKYGIIEAKIKLPSVNGSFPAFWTLRDNPKSYPIGYGEIDIMEHVNTETNIYSTVWNYNGDGENLAENSFNKSNIDVTKYHIYTLKWSEDDITFYVDDQEIGKVSNLDFAQCDGDNPLQSEHYLILNLAVGGDWAGNPRNSTTQMKMYVDWVRVYSKKS